MDLLTILLVGAIVLVGSYIVIYNGLIGLQQKVKEAWSGIDVQLKRRHDLIPNLVETVKGAAAHEKGTLEQVTKARQQAIDITGDSPELIAKAENFLSQTLKSLFALSENYPDLKANQNFLELQGQIEATEDQIAAARRIYNSNVTIYNTKVMSVPSNFVAKAHDFTAEEFFELDDAAERANPEVKFG